MSAEKRSVSAPEQLFALADARKAQLGYSTFSDYIQALMRADALGGGDHLRESVKPHRGAHPDNPHTPVVPRNDQTDTSYFKHKGRKK